MPVETETDSARRPTEKQHLGSAGLPASALRLRRCERVPAFCEGEYAQRNACRPDITERCSKRTSLHTAAKYSQAHSAQGRQRVARHCLLHRPFVSLCRTAQFVDSNNNTGGTLSAERYKRTLSLLQLSYTLDWLLTCAFGVD
jgi:hypothetical protein